MPKYWMITNRNVDKDELGSKVTDLTFYVSDKAKVEQLKNWTPCSGAEFRRELIATADAFPLIPETIRGLREALRSSGGNDQ